MNNLNIKDMPDDQLENAVNVLSAKQHRGAIFTGQQAQMFTVACRELAKRDFRRDSTMPKGWSRTW